VDGRSNRPFGTRLGDRKPGTNNLPRLNRNIELSGFTNVTVVERPACAGIGEATFFLNNDDSGGNALWNPLAFAANKTKPTALRLQTTTLDHEVTARGLPRPRVIKIDTEGAELHVLQGARALLHSDKPLYVIAEYNAFGLQQMGGSTAALRRLMAEAGFEMFALYANDCLPKWIPEGTELRTPFLSNVLFARLRDMTNLWPEDPFDPSVFPKEER
jgi:FkbM family methyltransferase